MKPVLSHFAQARLFLRLFLIPALAALSLFPAPSIQAAPQPEANASEERDVMKKLKDLSLDELLEVSVEYKVKAAYLYNFLQYTEWPDSRFASPQEAYKLCILGSDPFGNALDPMLQRTVKGTERGIQVDYIDNMQAAAACHLLYVSQSKQAEIEPILSAVGSQAILTVSDMDGFAPQGGMIGMTIRDGSIYLEINLTVIERSSLNLKPALRNFKFATYL